MITQNEDKKYSKRHGHEGKRIYIQDPVYIGKLYGKYWLDRRSDFKAFLNSCKDKLKKSDFSKFQILDSR